MVDTSTVPHIQKPHFNLNVGIALLPHLVILQFPSNVACEHGRCVFAHITIIFWHPVVISTIHFV